MLHLYVSRNIFVLTVCLALLIQAYWIDDGIFARHRQPRWIYARQLDSNHNMGSPNPPLVGTGQATLTTTSPQPAPTIDAPMTTATETPSTSKTPATLTSSSKPTETSENPPDSPTPTKTAHKSSSTSVNIETKTATAEPTTTIEVITSVVTLSGSVITSIASSTIISSFIADPTDDASIPNDNINNSSGSTETKTKNTIIGVVVGIGGAALLGGLFYMVWRVWGHKKNPEDDNGLMDFQSGSPGQEKISSSGNTRSINPFQSTLENYHNPARVNASSNF